MLHMQHERVLGYWRLNVRSCRLASRSTSTRRRPAQQRLRRRVVPQRAAHARRQHFQMAGIAAVDVLQVPRARDDCFFRAFSSFAYSWSGRHCLHFCAHGRRGCLGGAREHFPRRPDPVQGGTNRFGGAPFGIPCVTNGSGVLPNGVPGLPRGFPGWPRGFPPSPTRFPGLPNGPATVGRWAAGLGRAKAGRDSGAWG